MGCAPLHNEADFIKSSVSLQMPVRALHQRTYTFCYYHYYDRDRVAQQVLHTLRQDHIACPARSSTSMHCGEYMAQEYALTGMLPNNTVLTAAKQYNISLKMKRCSAVAGQ